ncbi:ATP-dependent Clp protease adapter ClpS [Acaricomes phytoseiuli]|uniref:ATP-dependent Clp protease adapter ClpS n=1 Tax=Acaricomes phytoseiuli TaxID=291968 RepID=UPI00036D3EB6|nr:ATP-dependent Clp protease adapter ClpS [Acaricomes phytoseiuli]MCW1248744.1 ATP-dependent Clp protease adapter ClpS [Acaricomes phytoseiuli]
MSISTLPERLSGLPASSTQAGTQELTLEAEQLSAFEQRPWSVLVWDDPVNTMEYVTFVFQSYFGYAEDRAEALMMQVHTEGRAVVAKGSREKAETDVMAMHSYGLQASVSQESR